MQQMTISREKPMSSEQFAIVELKNVEPHAAIQQPVIVRIVRTYETNSRAIDDLELLRDTITTHSYSIVTVEHIDS